MLSSIDRPPISNALAEAAPAARIDEPATPVPLDFGREEETVELERSTLPAPRLQIASEADRLGMNRSAALYAMRTLDFEGRDRLETLFATSEKLRVEEEEGIEGPVPVNVQSDKPRSSRRGDSRPKTMFDFLVDLRADDFDA